MRSLAATLAAIPLLVVGCGGSSLEAEDPAGYKACQLYAEAANSHDPVVRMGLPMFEVGDRASEAKTAEIRDAVKSLTDQSMVEQYGMPETWDVDDEALTAACEANGVAIP